jgi:hypothetical protein
MVESLNKIYSLIPASCLDPNFFGFKMIYFPHFPQNKNFKLSMAKYYFVGFQVIKVYEEYGVQNGSNKIGYGK